MSQRWFAALGMVVVVGMAADAQAQRGEARVRDLTREAMDAYTNLDLEAAQRQLEEALEEARRGNVRGRTLAQVHVDLGIVAIGGSRDFERGIAEFVEALEADPTIELDPMLSNPSMERAFQRARQDVERAAAAAEAPSLPHEAALEQLVHTPLPVYVALPGDVAARQAVVHFRAGADGPYREAAMARIGDGFGAELPCADVAEPAVSYYVELLGADGRVVARVGSEDAPIVVPIVTERSVEAPALPTRSAPEPCDAACGAGEACSGPAEAAEVGQTGDACELDADCGDGLACEAGACSADPFAPTGEPPRYFFHVGYTLGSATARRGGIADRSVPRHPSTKPAGWNEAVNGPYAPPGYGSEAEWLQDMVIQYAGYTENPNRAPYPLAAPVNVNGTTITEGPIYPDPSCDAGPGDYCVRLEDQGLLFVSGFDFNLGYWIVPRFAVTVGLRVALHAGRGTLSRLLLTVRGQYQVTRPKPTGFHLSLFAGTGLGQVQLRPPQGGKVPDPTPQGAADTITIDEPFIVTGLGNASAGAVLGYRFIESFGLVARPTLNVMFPAFTVVMEATVGVEVAF